jgi:hypothetical protein
MENKFKRFTSTRVTIQISQDTQDISDLLTNMYQITQKELIYQLSEMFHGIELDIIQKHLSKGDRLPKTIVFPEYSFRILQNQAIKFNLHRDEVFEGWFKEAHNKLILNKQKVENMLPVINNISEIISDSIKLLSSELGSEHPICDRLALLSVISDNLVMSIESHLINNTPIHPDDVSDTGCIIIEEERWGKSYREAKNVFVKVYSSPLRNASLTLAKPTLISVLKKKLDDSDILDCLDSDKNYFFWDFGKKATEYLKINDNVWIVTNDKIYTGMITNIIKDPKGIIGDALGWARQFKSPWVNPVALKNVTEESRLPDEVKRRINEKPFKGINNFFKL